jgi:hypothetical protein
MNSGNACYNLVRMILPCRPHSETLKIRTINRVIISPLVLDGCETCLLLCGNNINYEYVEGVLRKIFGAKKDK